MCRPKSNVPFEYLKKWVTTCSRLKRVGCFILMLVELEDLNPYLSLLEVDAQTRAQFMQDFVAALEKAANETQNIGI